MTLPVEIDTAILAESDWSAIQSIAPELSDAYAKRQIFRTETEARVSVLDDIRRPTPASKYWQALREQCVMLEQLAILSFDYRRNEVALKRHQRRLAAATDDLDRADAQIDIDECLFKRAGLEATAADRAREIMMWSKLKAEFDDGSFDTGNCDTHQLVSYTARFAIRAAVLDQTGAKASPDETSNLAGQLQTAIRRCREVGAMAELAAALPGDLAQQLQLEVK